MPCTRPWSACVLLALITTVIAWAQPGMMGPGMMGPGMMPGQGGGMMPGMMGSMGGAAATPKWVSPLVPLCWAVGRTQYPGIACLYSSDEERAELEAIIKQVAPAIEGRFWIKFADVTADTDPPSFITDILERKYRDAKGSTSSAGAGMMPGMNANVGMMPGQNTAGGTSQNSVSDAEKKMAARRACPAIVIFGKDLFSVPGGSSSTAGAAGPGMMPGMNAGPGMMPGMNTGPGMMPGQGGGGMGGGQSATMWSKMDHNYMIYWSFVGAREMPGADLLKYVLDAVGEPEKGINRLANQLKLGKENARLTLQLGEAYVQTLDGARKFLPQLDLANNPARGRMAQQNQYMADYMLARAESLGGAVSTIRELQKKLGGTFRYEGPSGLIPLMCENFPGLVGFYRNANERKELEKMLDAAEVQKALQDSGYWCKLINVLDESAKDDKGATGILRDAKLNLEITDYPALVLCGQDIFRDKTKDQPIVTIAAGSSGGGMMGGAGGGMAGGMGMMGGPGGGMGGGMMGGGGGAASSIKPTDWLSAASSTGSGAGGGMMGGPGGGMAGGMMGGGGGMAGGMGMMGGMGGGMGMMGGMGGGTQASMGTLTFNDWNYRMPARTAYLMQYWTAQGTSGSKAIPSDAATLGTKIKQAASVDTASRAVQVEPKHDNVDKLLSLSQAYADLGRHYMADYFLTRAEKFIAAERKKLAEADTKVRAAQFLPEAEKKALTSQFANRITRMDRVEPQLLRVRRQILDEFLVEDNPLQIPALMAQYPGIVVLYEADGNFNPDIEVDKDSLLRPDLPSAQRNMVNNILRQPHVRAVLGERYWMKQIRVGDDLNAKGLGIDEKPDFVKDLPAILLVGPDLFATPQITGGKGNDGDKAASPGGAAGGGMAGPGGGMMGGMGGPGMAGPGGGMMGGMGGGMMGMGGGSASGSGDPAAWLPASGAASSSGGGMMGGMGGGMAGGGMGMMGGGMGGGMPGGGMMGMGGGSTSSTADARTGVLTGNTPNDGVMGQWVDYEDPNQMGQRTGNIFIYWAWVGLNQMPATVTPAMPAVPTHFNAAAKSSAPSLVYQYAVNMVRATAWRSDAQTIDIWDPVLAKEWQGTANEAEKAATAIRADLEKLIADQDKSANKKSDYLDKAGKWSDAILAGWYSDPFVRKLQMVSQATDTSWRVYNNEKIEKDKTEAGVADGQMTLEFARQVAAVPSVYLTEMALGRVDYQLEKVWTPNVNVTKLAIDRTVATQGKNKANVGADYLPTIYAYLSKKLDQDAPVAEAAGAWLGGLTALYRSGRLPLFSASQYAGNNTADGDLVAAMTGWGAEVVLRSPAHFQLDAKGLTDAQLQNARNSLLSSLETGLSPEFGKVVWSRLFATELELRDRKNVAGIDNSWRQIMGAWKRLDASANTYRGEAVKGMETIILDELQAIRSMALIDGEVQKWLAQPDKPVTISDTVGEAAQLNDFVGRYPDSRMALQARYVLALAFGKSFTADNIPPQIIAQQEQEVPLQAYEQQPSWWRWGPAMWQQVKQH